MVLRNMMELSSSERDLAVTWLLIGAIFFAMRSCKYLKTAETSRKRTRIVTVRDIVFKKKNSVLDHDKPELGSADLVEFNFVSKRMTSEMFAFICSILETVFCVLLKHGQKQYREFEKSWDPLTSQKYVCS